MTRPEKRLRAKFFKNERGREPVRDWLLGLPPEDRKKIGGTIRDVEFGWPIGMPVVDSIKGHLGLWEARTSLKDGIARVFFVVKDERIVLLHGIIKKTQKTPKTDIALAKKRMNMG
jgi:phage-related protein